MKNSTLSRFISLSTFFTFLMISISLLDLAENPVKDYELSIYSSTPMIFWISIILGLVNGFFLTYIGVTDKIKKVHVLGIFQILFVNSLVLLLYGLRNYIICMLRGDSATYIGLINDVSIFGNTGSDFYPFTSIMVSQLHQISDIPVFTLTKYIPAIFYIFSVLSVYCLSKSLIQDEKYIIFAVIATTPLFFAWFSTGVYYMLLSVFTLPLFFYTLINLKDLRFKILIVILCFVYPSFHPFTSIIVLFYLFVSYFTQRYPLNGIKKYSLSVTLLTLSSVSLIFWFIYQYAIVRSLTLIVENIFGMLEAPSAVSQATYYSEKLGLYSTIRTLLFLLSDEIIFYFLAVIAVYYIIFRKDPLDRERFFPLITCFIAGSLLLLFLFTSTFAHRPDRLLNLNFNMMLAPILVAYVLYLNQKNRLKTLFLISLILLATMFTYFSLYQSPVTMRPNDYMTLSEYHGANWVLSNKSPLIKTVDLANPISRYADFIYGVNFRANRDDLTRDFILSDHFGFAAQFDGHFPIDRDRYLSLSTYDEEAYTNIWKNAQRFETEDFKKVDKCKNVFKIFEDGGFRTYLIRI